VEARPTTNAQQPAEAGCPRGQRNAALAVLAVAATAAIALLVLALLAGVRTEVPRQAGPAPTAGAAPEQGAEPVPAVPPSPPDQQAPSTEPVGGSPPGEGGGDGVLAGPAKSDSSFGFSVAPAEAEVVGTPKEVEEVTADAGGSGGQGGTGTGSGDGDGDGRGAGEFMGIAATGKNIVYVIDRSGSMEQDNRIYHTKLELKRAIESLGPEHKFLVVLFDSTAEAMPGGTLVKADDAGKRGAVKWLAKLTKDTLGPMTEPSAAMRLALAARPDTVYLMTDGVFVPEPTMEAIADLNGDRGIVINTIAFHVRAGEETLMRIAEENGGTYRFIPRPAGAR
jgi:hypothetical protein